MKRFLFAASAALLLLSASVRAESLRCNGQSAGPGDSRLSVLQKCGEPMLKDSFCKPVEALVPGYPYPIAVPPRMVTCEMVDEWWYDRGPGNLTATVRFERGRVEDIRYESRPAR